MCQRFDTGRERDAGRLYESGYSSSVASPKFLEGPSMGWVAEVQIL